MRGSVRRIAMLSTAAALLMAGCGTSAGQESTSGKYDQTWQTPYGQTTCGDWRSQMSEHERWVAAADMLVGIRDQWGIKDMPSDSLVDTFKDDITQGCEPIASLTLTDTAASLAMIGGQAQYGD